MKILQVNCVYKRGSTGKIVADIHQVLLERGLESVVCYGRQRGAIAKEKNIYKYCTELEGDINNFSRRYLGKLQFGGCYFSTLKLISIIKKERPDVVHLHCINGSSVNIYKLLSWLAKSGIKTVVTHHAEFYYTGSCAYSYNCEKWQSSEGCNNCPNLLESTGSRFFDNTQKAWNKMKSSFSKFDRNNIIFTAVSPWVKQRFELSPITNDFRCEVIENGVETSIFCIKNKSKCLKLRDKLGIPLESKMVFHATASFILQEESIKGGRFVCELAKKNPSIYFVVAALSYDKIDDCPSNLLLVGSAKTQEDLAIYYSSADLTLLTSKRETFSMVTVESLCCGTPIVGFEAGGPESIAIEGYSTFVEYGNLELLNKKLNLLLYKDFNKNNISKDAIKRYSKQIMTDNYIELYNQILSI